MTNRWARNHRSKFNYGKLRVGGVGGWENPFGESWYQRLWVGFDRSAEINSRGALVNTEPGLPALREQDEAMGLTGAAAVFSGKQTRRSGKSRNLRFYRFRGSREAKGGVKQWL